MPKKNELLLMHELLHIKHQDVRWSNFLIKAAFACSLIEKRALYFISLWVKRNFTEKELGVPDNWKELYMHLTDADLGIIGGTKNIPRTYEALKLLARKLVPVSYVNDRGERVNGRIHWIDAFFYNTATKEYDVRVSPEILPYMINVEKNFTTIDVGEAMTFRSKVTQKIYEFLSMYSGNYRYTDTELKANGYVYAKNVSFCPAELLEGPAEFYVNDAVNDDDEPVEYYDMEDAKGDLFAIENLDALEEMMENIREYLK